MLVLISAEDQTEGFAHGTKYSTYWVTSPGLALGLVLLARHHVGKEMEAQNEVTHQHDATNKRRRIWDLKLCDCDLHNDSKQNRCQVQEQTLN